MVFDPISYILGAKSGGGGGGVTVEPLSVSENGTYQETGKAYAPVEVNVPNPNFSETINGTLQNLNLPSGAFANVFQGNATILIEIDGTAIGAGKNILPTLMNTEGTQLRATGSVINSGGVAMGVYVAWLNNGRTLYEAWLYTPSTGAVDLSSYPLPTKTTYIYHPLPENNT